MLLDTSHKENSGLLLDLDLDGWHSTRTDRSRGMLDDETRVPEVENVNHEGDLRGKRILRRQERCPHWWRAFLECGA
jgi:hypothetical protein